MQKILPSSLEEFADGMKPEKIEEPGPLHLPFLVPKKLKELLQQ
jgi:hypothetical protein